MKVFSKIMAAVLAVTMLFTLCACGNNGDNSDSGMANYQVKVLDGEGKALTTGVIVKFLKDGQQVAMQPVNGEGIASKELAKGDYTVELVFTNSAQGGHYDASAAVLSADKTSLERSLVKTLGTVSYDLVVGEKTYGKGVVQNLYDLSGATVLKVTTAEWYTPKDRSINKTGITPDVEVERTYEDINAMRDPQMDKAKSL